MFLSKINNFEYDCKTNKKEHLNKILENIFIVKEKL